MILIFTFSESEVLLYWVSPGNLYASVVVTFFFFRKQIFTYDLEVSEKKKSLDKLGSLKKTLNMWFQRDLSISQLVMFGTSLVIFQAWLFKAGLRLPRVSVKFDFIYKRFIRKLS